MAFFARLRSFAGWSKGHHLGKQLAHNPLLRGEELEERQLLSVVAMSFEFGTPTSPTAPGYAHVSPLAYSPQTGFGWQDPTAVTGVERDTPAPLTPTLEQGRLSTLIVHTLNRT